MYNYSSFSHGIRLRNNAAAAKAAQESSSKSIKTPCIPQSICASAANTATPCPAEAAAQSILWHDLPIRRRAKLQDRRERMAEDTRPLA